MLLSREPPYSNTQKTSLEKCVILSKRSWKYSWEIIPHSIIFHLIQIAQEALQKLKWNHSNQLNLSWAIRSKEHTVHNMSTPTSSIILSQFLWILFLEWKSLWPCSIPAIRKIPFTSSYCDYLGILIQLMLKLKLIFQNLMIFISVYFTIS